METRIERFGPADFDALTDLWEASVRATHTFLLQGEVERLRPYGKGCLSRLCGYLRHART